MMIKKATWQIFCAVLVCGWILPVSQHKLCVEPAGDVTKDGITNVVDIHVPSSRANMYWPPHPLRSETQPGPRFPPACKGI